MRRLIIIASLAVLAVAIATPFANAAVSYDEARIGHVDKGDVQALFGWNDAAMQKNAENVKFIEKRVETLDISWKCTNGETYRANFSGTATRTLDVTKLTNKAGKLTDWTLNGVSGPATIVNKNTGPELYTCPADSEWDWMSGTPSTFTATNVVQVSDGSKAFDLPVTPVAAPVA
jgi:hypothetical protein